MKLNSKSGATLAAAAATLFLAGSVVSTVSTSANAAAGKCMAGNACKGQSACKGASQCLQGPERLQGHRLLDGWRKGVRRQGRQVRQGLIGGSNAREGPALPGPRCFDPAAEINSAPRVTKARPTA